MSSYAEFKRHQLPGYKLPLMQAYKARTFGDALAEFNYDHFFHVMGRGWYIEISGGELGPFRTHAQAVKYLSES